MEGIKQHQFYLSDNNFFFYFSFVNNLFQISRCLVGCFCFPVSSHINHPFPMAQPAFFTFFFPHLLWSLISALFDVIHRSSAPKKSIFICFSNHCLLHVSSYFPKLLFIAHSFPKGLPLLQVLPPFGLRRSNAQTNIQQISSSSNTMGGAPSSPKQKLDKKLLS